MQEVLDCLEPHRSAKFIQSEVPKRIAVRIRMVENIYCWRRVPELVKLREDLNNWYKSLRLVDRGVEAGLDEFTSCVKRILSEGRDLVARTAVGIHTARQMCIDECMDEYDDAFFDKWMDGFFTSRIGTNM